MGLASNEIQCFVSCGFILANGPLVKCHLTSQLLQTFWPSCWNDSAAGKTLNSIQHNFSNVFALALNEIQRSASCCIISTNGPFVNCYQLHLFQQFFSTYSKSFFLLTSMSACQPLSPFLSQFSYLLISSLDEDRKKQKCFKNGEFLKSNFDAIFLICWE